MKKKLGIGSVRIDKRGMAHFLIRDKESIKNIIIPLFDTNTLLTSKEYHYLNFKKCFNISDNIGYTQIQKIRLITQILSITISDTYISSA
jgi:hypothetical protein